MGETGDTAVAPPRCKMKSSVMIRTLAAGGNSGLSFPRLLVHVLPLHHFKSRSKSMQPEYFWNSSDGQILSVKSKDPNTLALVLAFWPRNPAELEFIRARLNEIHFTERSTLARIGIEMITPGVPRVDHNRLILETDAFLFDPSFPNAPYWKKLLRPGTPVGRLFYAPESAKLATNEIWEAVKENRLKLPNTISIDRLGRVFLTPHKVRYTLNPRLQRPEFERLINGDAGRGYLDKVQVRQDVDILSVPPRSGTLTSCSMYLKEHFVVLNRGEGNFGLHCGAILLDPIKTFGTNVMLEIYNSGDQPVVNPMVSVEVFRAPTFADPEVKTLERKRRRLFTVAGDLYRGMDRSPPRDSAGEPRPKTRITVKGQNALMENYSAFLGSGDYSNFKTQLADPQSSPGFRTLIQALDHAPEGADTLVVDYFPNLMEHVELLTRIPQLKLKRIIFRKPSRTHGFFLSGNAHARLDTYFNINLDVYWYNEGMKDLYLHTYKRDAGFFIREEMGKLFQESTILAFYGSAVEIGSEHSESITALISKLTGFIGPKVGILTGGGGGVMRLATDEARRAQALTGACFLELEAQEPELGVDFFNTFQETSRHNRQKWFEVADFCIFNVGGVGTLEEIGIELCNLKLGIRPRVPYIFYGARYWSDLRKQFREMIHTGRSPAWMAGYVLFTDDPDEVVAFYRKTLQVL
jgi:predicted Rossmann-fold nucleotide-binding protein